MEVKTIMTAEKRQALIVLYICVQILPTQKASRQMLRWCPLEPELIPVPTDLVLCRHVTSHVTTLLICLVHAPGDYSDLYSPRGTSPRDFIPSRSLSLETPSDLWRDNSSTHESISVISSRLEELEKLEREKEEKEKQEQLERERQEQEQEEKQQQQQQQQQEKTRCLSLSS